MTSESHDRGIVGPAQDKEDPTRPYWNLTTLTLYIDVHIIDAQDDMVGALRRLRAEGWINLQRTDTMDTELGELSDTEKWAELTEMSGAYPEALGAAVLDHSRLDFCVVGSDEDATRLDEVFAILYPNADKATARRNHVRDAMHVATAIRYSGHAFVTRDKRILNKADSIAEHFSGFRIWSPEQALTEALSRVAGLRELHRREPSRGPLPSGPRPTVAD